MQVLADYKQQVLKDLRTRAIDNQYFLLPIGLYLSLQNITELHPGEMIYDTLWNLQNYPIALLGSILEQERCEQKYVQSSRFKT